LARLWEVIPKLQTGIEERASAADVAKLWNEIPGLVRAIDERAAQSDVSKLWSEIPRLHQAVAERGSQADVAQLFQQLELRATWAALEAQQQALSACNAGTDERIDAIWEGLAQRDRQVAQDTTAIQHLHRRDAEVREQMRGTVARLELLADQVALAQELVNGTAPVATPRAVSASAAPVVQDPAPIDSILQKQLDMAYLRFQRLHRGEEQELRARFARYPELIARLLPAGARCLDVACGDGLLLSLLGQQGFATQGVDLNETMVRHARERGLAVGHGDGIAFLESAEVASVDCVSALQFIEHLQPAQFMRFLRAAFRVLRPGGMILLETINPHSMRAWHWYFMDLTHARLIYPEITVLFAESVGFRAAEWHGINPAAEEERLVVPLAEGTEKRNAERLNKILYGPQDYFFIARKASTQ
jgi:O-antigen chain-terminating methyltransferase